MPSPPTPTAPEPAVVEAGADGVELAPDDLAMAHRGRVDARPRRRRPPLPTLGKRPEVAELPYDALRPLGVIGGLLICAAVDGLVGVDTTAARTWIRYDALRRGEAGQALGRPVSIELEADARARWVERAEALRALGFAVEPFGGKTHVVERVPTGVAPEAVEETLRALLDVDGDPAALAMACAEASVSDRPLLTGEGERLLDALAQIEHPLPRAVPLAFALTEDELRRKLSAP